WNAWTNRLGVVAALAIVTASFYRPVLDARFLNWDDPAYVTGNPGIKKLDWQTVVWAFTSFQEGIWPPLTWLSLALDYRIYGLQAWGFHCTNLLLHVANTVLVFLVWERLTGALWRSAVVAALFGLHPMHVESVAWVTERKDVLSTFFWLLTMAAYAWYAERPGLGRYFLVALALILGLMAKPMVVTLPAVLLLLDVWPLRRWPTDKSIASGSAPAPGGRLLLENLPLFLIVAATLPLTLQAQQGALRPLDQLPFSLRVSNALVSYVKYIGLMLWPSGLAIYYPHPFKVPPIWQPALAALLLAALTAGVCWTWHLPPYLAVPL